jgi:hypothetical protein
MAGGITGVRCFGITGVSVLRSVRIGGCANLTRPGTGFGEPVKLELSQRWGVEHKRALQADDEQSLAISRKRNFRVRLAQGKHLLPCGGVKDPGSPAITG